MYVEDHRDMESSVLVVGDVMLDRYILGTASRLSPEAPVPVVAAADHDIRPGGAANVGAGIAALGMKTTLLSITGDDQPSRQLQGVLEQFGVEFRAIRRAGVNTTEKIRVVSRPQQIVRIDYDINIDDADIDQLVDEYNRILPRYSAVVFSDYDKGVLRRLPAMIAAARDLGIPTFVDPKCADPEHYRGAFLIKPNANEFAALLGEDGALTAKAQEGLRKYEWENVVVTQSSEGMTHICARGTDQHYPATALEVFDVSGAGDTVLAALTVSYLRGNDVANAIEFANRAAAVAVSHAGTYVVTAADLEAHLAEGRGSGGKIRTLESVLHKLGQTKFNDAKVVFTNGCFDILHAGHVRLLNAARRHGDLLVVGLNSDESIRRLKGESRPINAFNDRAEVIAGLAAVDFVIGFEEDTPYDIIDAINPNVLVKGGDYRPEDIVGGDLVSRGGGKVIVIPLLEGRSTTSIIMKAQQADNSTPDVAS